MSCGFSPARHFERGHMSHYRLQSSAAAMLRSRMVSPPVSVGTHNTAAPSGRKHTPAQHEDISRHRAAWTVELEQGRACESAAKTQCRLHSSSCIDGTGCCISIEHTKDRTSFCTEQPWSAATEHLSSTGTVRSELTCLTSAAVRLSMVIFSLRQRTPHESSSACRRVYFFCRVAIR